MTVRKLNRIIKSLMSEKDMSEVGAAISIICYEYISNTTATKKEFLQSLKKSLDQLEKENED